MLITSTNITINHRTVFFIAPLPFCYTETLEEDRLQFNFYESLSQL